MNILRRLVVGLLAIVFFFASVGLAWSHIISRGTTAVGIKDWLNESNFYSNVTESILEGIGNAKTEEAGKIPVSDPAFKAKVNEVFDAQFLKTNTEMAVDSIFAWLNGDTQQPDFRIDLTEKRTQLASALGDFAVTKAQSLPACTEVPAEFDALSADCLPPGVALEQIKAQVENKLLNESTFITDTVITADTFSSKDQQKDIFSEVEPVREGYRMLKSMALVLGVITFLSALGIVMFSSTRRRGFLRLGIVSMFTTITLGLGYLALSQGPRLLNDKVVSSSGQVNQATKNLLTDMFENFAATNQKLLGLYAAGFLLLAIACFVAYASLNRKNNLEQKDDNKDPKPPIDDSPKTESTDKSAESEQKPEPKPADKPRPPRKIQL
jgi:hypothetical protein